MAAYTFQANSAAQGRSWVDAICNVQVGQSPGLVTDSQENGIERRRVVDRQNQFQRLCTEEVLRQQKALKRCTEEREEEEEESSTSTTSSPCLRPKSQQNSRYDHVQLQAPLQKKLSAETRTFFLYFMAL